jgi:hypothetical protein
MSRRPSGLSTAGPTCSGLDVFRILVRIATSDQSERVRGAAWGTRRVLRSLSHERLRRLLALEAGGDAIRAEQNAAAAGARQAAVQDHLTGAAG